MLAYHSKPEIKERYLVRVQKHYDKDKIVQGQYWEDGKGCAVGCTIHGNNHFLYESRLGIPVSLAYAEDTIFEGLDLAVARKWPKRFLSAIKPGQDLSKVAEKFAAWILTDFIKVTGTGDYKKEAKSAVKACVVSYQSGDEQERINAQGTTYELSKRMAAAAWESDGYGRGYQALLRANAKVMCAHHCLDVVRSINRDWELESCITNAADSVVRPEECYKVMSDKLVTLLRAAPMGKSNARK